MELGLERRHVELHLQRLNRESNREAVYGHPSWDSDMTETEIDLEVVPSLEVLQSSGEEEAESSSEVPTEIIETSQKKL